ncbi:MAG: PRC-barrel domain-containing protein [Proteobacteria bacterium]|nr:PRC-barrel domain-containing protein [Pseudomonadota bacterium]
MRLTSLLIGAASTAALAACAVNEPTPRSTARVEPRPAPITSPAARQLPPRGTTRTETARVIPAPRAATTTPAPVVTGPMAGEMNIARLIGTDVKDPAGQTIGEIENVLLDGTGRVGSVVVTVGSFLGFGGRDVELRWADLKSIDAGNEVRVDMTAMQLRQRPEWRPNASGTTATSGTAPEKK